MVLFGAEHWLMKSEPSVYSIHDLERDGRTMWDGIRNYQARNTMRDEMFPGQECLFYHSNADPTGVAGIMKVASEPYPDPTQFDRKSRYFEPKATEANPKWILVDMEWVETFAEVVTLQAIKEDLDLAGMMVTRRGARLSIQPVEDDHYDQIVRMGRGD